MGGEVEGRGREETPVHSRVRRGGVGKAELSLI